MALALTVLGIFFVLLLSEIWWYVRKPHDELSRKFIHIVVGSFAATWPFYLSWDQILLLSAAFIVVVAVSKYFHIFKAIHAVERPTWGEVYFAMAVGVLALVTQEPWIYAAALLHMSLADGLAAVTGVTWGGKTEYKVFRQTKSIVGSATFLVVSIGILVAYSLLSGTVLSPLTIAGLAMTATAVENVGVAGLDNLLIPLLVGVALLYAA
ncbi:MAG TPA: hypothetical protein VF575_03995 [Candidatus Saccharimonadales bacterium]